MQTHVEKDLKARDYLREPLLNHSHLVLAGRPCVREEQMEVSRADARCTYHLAILRVSKHSRGSVRGYFPAPVHDDEDDHDCKEGDGASGHEDEKP